MFNYQAVVRNTSGAVVQNQIVGVKISVLQGSSTGALVFSETHTPTTNNYGLISLQIGTGTNLGPQLNTIDWGTDSYFLAVQIDPAGGTSYTILSTTQLISVPYALYAKDVENNDDADADPLNETNTSASLAGTNLQLTDAGGTLTVDLSSLVNDADASPTNEIQTISKVGNIITLSNGGGAVTDDVNDADASPTNELNTSASLVGTTLNITDAGGTISVNLSSLGNDADASPTNELNTSANLSGTTLNITDAGGTLSVNLSSLVNDADASTTNELNTSANLSGTTLNITDAGGTLSVNLSSLVNDADASATNELNTGASLTGTTLNITDAGGTISVNLSSLQDGVNDADADPNNEIQTLSLVGSNLTISGGNTITLGSGTDSQILTLVGSDLSISNGNTVTLPSGGTDSQTLSLVGTNLSITGGNTVDLVSLQDGVNDADADPNNEIQTLSLVGSDLTISGGNTITLPSGGGTDSQTLSLSGADLSITGGNTVTLPIQTHFVGEHFGGGIIVFVDSSGQHGLICALADVGSFPFENTPNDLTTYCTSSYDGAANTAILIGVNAADFAAANACVTYNGGGFTDWYLPSIAELEVMLMANYVLGPNALTRQQYYWSSTEIFGGTNAYEVRNNTLVGTGTSELTALPVRPCRQF